MAAIRKVVVEIRTANAEYAGTDGRVYLGLAAREFRLATSGTDNFEQGSQNTFTLGDGSNVSNSALNDPRSPQLDTSDLDLHPVWLRLEEAGAEPSWALEGITVTVNSDSTDRRKYDTTWLAGEGPGHYVWLGRDSGKQVVLRRV
jgi:hypothetical protein